MRCYTLIPRYSGYISDWIKLVPQIVELGFDTIHILPITKMGQSLSPYSSTNPYVIDPMYDQLESSSRALKHFKHFVSVLKQHKIRLCVDIVLNHLAADHPLLQSNPRWSIHDKSEIDGMKRAGWQGDIWHKWEDLVLLDYERNMGDFLWTYMLNYVMFWAEFAANTDGFIRLDNLHSSHEAFTEYVLAQVHLKFPKIQFYSELFTDEDTIRQLIGKYNYSYLLATLWEHKCAYEIRNYLSCIHSDSLPIRYLSPVLSHDSGSMTEEFGSNKSAVPRFVLSALMTSGDWGIVQGGEYGIESRLDFIGSRIPVSWYNEQKFNETTYQKIISKLNFLIEEYRMFSIKGNLGFIREDHEKVVSVIRYEKGAERDTIHPTKEYALVFANLDTEHPHTMVLDEPLFTKYGFKFPSKYIDTLTDTEYLINYCAKSNTRQLTLTFAPAQALVLMI